MVKPLMQCTPNSWSEYIPLCNKKFLPLVKRKWALLQQDNARHHTPQTPGIWENQTDATPNKLVPWSISCSSPCLISNTYCTSTTKRKWKLQWRSSLLWRTRTGISMASKTGRKVASDGATWQSLFWMLGWFFFSKLKNKANKSPKYCKTLDSSE